jgi:PIN domain nuclease of toxin-antitoxin system
MRILLDTHAFIWWDSAPNRLPAAVLDLCADPDNTLLFSVASAWEMQIKLQIGKLRLAKALAIIIEDQQRRNHIDVLPVTLAHVLALSTLPLHHKDPFDRLLIAQAAAEAAVVVTHDPIFKSYPVTVRW